VPVRLVFEAAQLTAVPESLPDLVPQMHARTVEATKVATTR
jgi:hypothetical protein